MVWFAQAGTVSPGTWGGLSRKEQSSHLSRALLRPRLSLHWLSLQWPAAFLLGLPGLVLNGCGASAASPGSGLLLLPQLCPAGPP